MPASQPSPGLCVQCKCLAQVPCCSRLKLDSPVWFSLNDPRSILKGIFHLLSCSLTFNRKEVKPNPWEICCLHLCKIFFFFLTYSSLEVSYSPPNGKWTVFVLSTLYDHNPGVVSHNCDRCSSHGSKFTVTITHPKYCNVKEATFVDTNAKGG